MVKLGVIRLIVIWSRAVVKLSTMLIISGNSSTKTHYDVLSVKQDASYNEIRASYKTAILNSHPDKLQTIPDACNTRNKFLDVQKAWEVLSDSNSRSNYDKELRALRCEDHIAAEEIRLEEMLVEVVADSMEFFHQCRCGDYFTISNADLEEMGVSLGENGEVIGICRRNDIMSASVVLPCGSCSLNIRLILDVNC